MPSCIAIERGRVASDFGCQEAPTLILARSRDWQELRRTPDQQCWQCSISIKVDITCVAIG
eukprot:6094507-Amphidinium_carterae.2